MNVLSIQSTVACGHVGNAAAVLPLQRLGHEVWAINTVSYSNHPAHGGWRGRTAKPAEIAEIVDGIGERGVLADCGAVLSGYLGDPGTGEIVLDAVAAVKKANPKALYCCDPVMGDMQSGFFVAAGIPEFFRERALGHADILCPNPFELEVLAECEVDGVHDARDAAERLLRLGPGLVVVTGLEDGADIAMLAVSPLGAWCVTAPWFETASHGAGDTFAALFLGHYLRDQDPAAALSHAGSAMADIMRATSEAGSADLQLVGTQDAFARPTQTLKAVKIG